MCNIDVKHTTPTHHIQNVGSPELYYTEDEIANAKREYSNRWYQQNKGKRISQIELYQQQNRDAVNSQRRIRYAKHNNSQPEDNTHNG